MESPQREARKRRRGLLMVVLAASSLATSLCYQSQHATADERAPVLSPPVPAAMRLDAGLDRTTPERSKATSVGANSELGRLAQASTRRDSSTRRDDDNSSNDDSKYDNSLDDRDDDFDADDEENSLSSALSDRRITQLDNGRFGLPPMAAPVTATAGIGNGKIPDGFRGSEIAPMVKLPESGLERNLDPVPWSWTVSHWAAANTFSHPRYFEDRMLERHGHERFPALQPFVSGARFFGTVPMLPYLMTLSHPCDCESTLGYYRSGSCAPVMHQQPPRNAKAFLVEAVAVGAAIAIIP